MNWITKDGKKIDLSTYNDINHKRNILRMLERNLERMPEIPQNDDDDDYDIDGSTSEQYMLYQLNSYDAKRNRIIRYIEWLRNNINVS